MIPRVGPSTIAALTAATVILAAFVASWAQGEPSPILAAIAAALTAAVGVLRSWQAVQPPPQEAPDDAQAGS